MMFYSMIIHMIKKGFTFLILFFDIFHYLSIQFADAPPGGPQFANQCTSPPCLIASAAAWENLPGKSPAAPALSSSENVSYKGQLCWSGNENCTLAAALALNQRWATLEKARKDFSVCLSPPPTSISFLWVSALFFLSFAVCLCLSISLLKYISQGWNFRHVGWPNQYFSYVYLSLSLSLSSVFIIAERERDR